MRRRRPWVRDARLAVVALVAVAAVSGCAGGGSGTSARPATGDRVTDAPTLATVASPTPATPATPAAPAGDPAPTPLRRGERFQTVRLPGGTFRPAAPGAGHDDYHCFLIDPHLRRDAFVTGTDVLPGQPSIVHHAILFRVLPGEVAAAQAQDAASPGQGWTCFGGTGLPTAADGRGGVSELDAAPWLAAWAPGGGESVFRGRTGVRLPAGGRIVLQVHYNLRAIGGRTLTDDTRVRLRLAPGTAALEPLSTMLLVAPVELPCTPDESGPLCNRGASMLELGSRFGPDAGRTVAGLQLLCGGSLTTPRAGPVQHCDRRAPTSMVVRAVAGHMHLLGRSISVTLNPGTARATTLLDRPVWDFDRQAATPLAHPVRVARGDTLRVTCRHDAGLRALLPELAGTPPRYVTWGEGTTDEMCLGIVLWTRH